MTLRAEYKVPGIAIRDHEVQAPLNWSDPDAGPTVTVFARELTDLANVGDDLPLLLFLQGGPGGEGPRPMPGGWWTTALKTHRVVLIDQRGTGRSSRIDGHTLSRYSDARSAANYLSHFRADAIVADAELIRQRIYGGAKWSTLGQSYGGFITLAYLSKAPEALTSCYVTGGIPGLVANADEVYRRTYPRMVNRNEAFRSRYPGDVAILTRIADLLAEREVLLPDGDRLTTRRLQTLGMPFGMSTGFEGLHWLLEQAFTDDGAELTDAFLTNVMQRTGYSDNPLYAVLQEVIYAQGSGVVGWAAERERANWPEFDPARRPLGLSGEMMYPWMFDEIRSLRPFRDAAHELAKLSDWPALYDEDRLAANDVPLAAVHYVEDPYVDLELATQTLGTVGNSRSWVTNEFLHDGLRVSAEQILPRLMQMALDPA